MGALSLLSSGCFPEFNIRNIDQVPGDSASSWEKLGAMRLDIGRARLECGALSPWDEGTQLLEREGYIDFGSQLNHWVQISACMEKAGYTNKSIKFYNAKSDVELTCNTWKKKYTLPACQPGAPVMERSVKRRLNSRYCRLQRDYAFCKANAWKPEACDKRVRPDPECLP
jgi:hypothetical protein